MRLITLAIIFVVTSFNQAKRHKTRNDRPVGSIRAYAIKMLNDDDQRSREPSVLSYRKSLSKLDGRRKDSSSLSVSSSSRELDDWKDEWKNMWLEKKFEYMNSSRPTRGDAVNMAAARPWGVRCGEPGHHELLWGTCMLPMECEPEFRIYRGDHFCGRSEFICCALESANYDLYHGFDATLEHSSLETDSQDKSAKEDSTERRKRNRERERTKRKNNREQRQKKIKRTIKNIQKEIKRLLNRNKKNVTRERKRKSKQLYKYLKHLKQIYKKDWDAVRDIHELELIKIDKAFVNKLNEVVGVNKEFMKNDTFRMIVTERLVSKKIARALVEQYPELAPYLPMENITSEEVRRRMDDRDSVDYEEW